MPRRHFTKPQARQMARALQARHGRAATDSRVWVRAQDHGQRVTLASLHYRGYLERRVHSGAGTTSPAHEYKLPEDLYAAWLARQGQ